MTIEKLGHKQLKLATDADLFDFVSSDTLTPAGPCLGQQRLVEILQSALAVEGPRCHLLLRLTDTVVIQQPGKRAVFSKQGGSICKYGQGWCS